MSLIPCDSCGGPVYYPVAARQSFDGETVHVCEGCDGAAAAARRAQ